MVPTKEAWPGHKFRSGLNAFLVTDLEQVIVQLIVSDATGHNQRQHMSLVRVELELALHAGYSRSSVMQNLEFRSSQLQHKLKIYLALPFSLGVAAGLPFSKTISIGLFWPSASSSSTATRFCGASARSS